MVEEEKTAGGRRRWEHWTEEQAQAVLEELTRSGMSMRQFAQSKEISTQRISYWKKRLADGRPTTFVAVPLPATRLGGPPERSQIEIGFGAITIRVREDLDVEHLTRIVGALARGAG